MIYRCLSFVLLFFFISTSPAKQTGNWRPLPIRSKQEFDLGLPGGEGEQHPHSMTRCLNFPETVYLSHDVGGAWKSTDGGDTWNKCLDKGLYLPFGQSIAVDPNDPDFVFIIVDNSYNYLAENFEGLYRSTDGGTNWQLVLQTDVNFNSSRHRIFRSNITYDPSTTREGKPAARWYAAFPENGLFRSDNLGLSWDKVSSLSNHLTVYGVYTHPSDGKTVYVGTDIGFYISEKLGEDLKKTGNLEDGPVSSVAVHPQNPEIVYVTIRNKGLYKSTDGGSSFERIKAIPAARVVMNPGFPDKLYLIGLSQNSIFSNDGGETWENFGAVTTFPGLGRESGWRRWIDGDLSGLVPDPSDKDKAAAFSRSTLFKSTTGGAKWNECATGYTGNAWSWWNGAAAFDRLNPERFAFFNNDVGMRITLSGGNYFEANTNPNAYSWYQEEKISWFGTYAGDFQPLAESRVIVASVGNYFDTQLMRSADNGKSWRLVTEGDADEDMNLFISFHPQEPNIVYAGNKISTDGGLTFRPFNIPAKYGTATLVGICRNQPDVLFAVDGERRTILRSRNRGANWEEYARPGWRFIRLDNLPTFAADPMDADKFYTLDANYDLAVFDGSTWKSLKVLPLAKGHSTANFVRTVTVDPNDPEVVYAGMFENGISCIFRSRNGGDSWQDITENLPRNGMSAMAVNPHTGELYKGSCIGTWVYPAPGNEKTDNNTDIPAQYILYGAFPNPFVSATKIRYHMEKSSRVEVSVYNVLGEKVAQLVKTRQGPGEHDVLFDAGSLPSGVYICRLEVDGVRQVKKMLVRR
ncbi:T9SS type A sorting domain-containing protein [candidate division KSB1 bacterium]|nr:T9SS type A sorting domain-containing protein [candidate division KSB1 bacterium]